MRICVLQSAYPDNHSIAQHDPGADPSRFTDEHTFEHRWIHKTTAKEQIDAAIAENFDFYFNFMWGQYEDDVAGIEACQYFEKFGLPAAGVWSEVLLRTKNDFYRDARGLGTPRVPGISNYPFFVNPSTGCSKYQQSPRTWTHSVDGIPIPDDVVVQEFIQGWDHSVVIVEIGNTPVPLAPERYIYPSDFNPHTGFLTFDTKFHHDTSVEILNRKDDPALFEKLQATAIEAFYTNKSSGKGWCNVDIRVPTTGDPVVIEVNPMPSVFLPEDNEWEDKCIWECFPGGQRALIDTLISTSLLQRGETASEQYGLSFEEYDTIIQSVDTKSICEKILSHGSSGTVLELGSGNGYFGRAMQEFLSQEQSISVTGIESSHDMVERCRETGAYSTVYHGTIPSVTVAIHSGESGKWCNHKRALETTFASPPGWRLIRPSGDIYCYDKIYSN
ncbi:hypothetical protein ASPWEDRAFT_169853 [Aspergillus wentii DTO 134E9]|uniref:ATP-grasp domain-containing protein n=1 Tax=Aspergillus wentii DTO 134E9 TaxID=1073089 RepID=A0A1L9RN13_ASPWE|nr:uncharacterized protein ASPWEDRAFT_169853 [Aspergillus wentii DTO 134E9]OJJ36325.1 hypothetical protein ASPWEDRAFT_169853 [Aspergillus wentii DTO 134E9]